MKINDKVKITRSLTVRDVWADGKGDDTAVAEGHTGRVVDTMEDGRVIAVLLDGLRFPGRSYIWIDADDLMVL